MTTEEYLNIMDKGLARRNQQNFCDKCLLQDVRNGIWLIDTGLSRTDSIGRMRFIKTNSKVEIDSYVNVLFNYVKSKLFLKRFLR